MTPILLTLEDEFTRLTIAPEIGGSLVDWTVRETGHPILRPSTPDALGASTSRRLGGYPLVPWSNRIGQGGFDCPQGWLALTPNSPGDALPVHGSGWQQPWQVVEHSAEEVLLQLDSEIPFAYRATQRIRLSGGELQMTLRVVHQAESPAWHGLGLHPYLVRTAHTRLQARAESVWLTDEHGLPTGLEERPSEWVFDEIKGLPANHVDHGFTGWDGRAVIEQPDLGYRLECSASGTDYYLLYCPKDRDFFCFEPVSHPVNAHHLPGRPGLKLLAQGESVEMTFALKFSQL